MAPIYRGPVYVLVDAADSSATFLFASLLRQAHRGALVGEPTGGNQRGINGGAFFFLHLPRSGLAVDIPLIGYFPARFAPDSGLNLDIFVRPTPADSAAGRDVALAAVRADKTPADKRAP